MGRDVGCDSGVKVGPEVNSGGVDNITGCRSYTRPPLEFSITVDFTCTGLIIKSEIGCGGHGVVGGENIGLDFIRFHDIRFGTRTTCY